MDNSMASRPLSPLKGDPYRAYEALPAEVRLALQEALVDWCPLRAREWHLDLLQRARLRPAQAAFLMVQTIRRQDEAELAAFARRWAKGAAAYPHLAAGATRQRYAGPAGMPAAEPIVVPAPAPRAKPPVKVAVTGKARGTTAGKMAGKTTGKTAGKTGSKAKDRRPKVRRGRR